MQTKSKNFTLGTLTILFFCMGFITTLNDTLLPYMKKAFNLNYFEASLVQFCFFGAYFITGGLFGKLLKKIGYPMGMVLGFFLAALGAILFYPAGSIHSYPVFLGALFILASGVVLLQTTGNPYVTLLSPGKEERSLTLVQAFNSLGTIISPLFGAYLIIGTTQSEQNQSAQSVQLPYIGIAIVLIMFGILMYLLKLPDARKIEESANEESHDGKTSAWQYKHFVFGAGAIFFYVGAEVAIASFLVSMMETFINLSQKEANKYLVLYWGGLMVGRFLGSFIMTKIIPNRLLAFNAFVSIVLIIVAILIGGGWTSIYMLMLVGLFNSIMFPTIFSLATKGVGKFTSQASGIINMAIVGGAIVPPIQGFLADHGNLILSYFVSTQGLVAHHSSLLISYFVPMLCYFYILFFALKGYKAQ